LKAQDQPNAVISFFEQEAFSQNATRNNKG